MKDPPPNELDQLVEWVLRQDRPEIADALWRPTNFAGPVAAPGVPLLSHPFQFDRERRLYLTPQPARAPLDLMGVYSTASEHNGGLVYPLDEIIDVLRTTPRSALVRLCSARRRYHRSTTASYRRRSSRPFAPHQWKDGLIAALAQPERVFTSPQISIALLGLALYHCREGDEEIEPVVAGPLLLALADHIGGRPSGMNATLMLARLGVMYRTRNPQSAWGRYERLFREIAPSMTSDPQYVDTHGVIEQCLGIEFDDYEALGMAMYLLLRGTMESGPPKLATELAGIRQTTETKSAFFDAWAIDDTAPPSLGASTFGWDFSEYRLRPLIRIADIVVPVSVHFVLDKGTDGLFFTVADCIRARDGDRASLGWRAFFGRVWERYVFQLVRAGVGDDARVVPETRLKEVWGRHRVCDNVILYPNAWLLVEAESRRLTRDTIARGTIEDLQQDLRRAVTDKAVQLSSTIARLRADARAVLSDAPTEGCRYFPVVVLPGPFPHLPPIVDEVRQKVATDSRCSELRKRDVEKLMVLDGDDLDLLFSATHSQGTTPVDLLGSWQASRFDGNSFSDWFATEGRTGQVETLGWIADAADALLDRTQQTLQPSA